MQFPSGRFLNFSIALLGTFQIIKFIRWDSQEVRKLSHQVHRQASEENLAPTFDSSNQSLVTNENERNSMILSSRNDTDVVLGHELAENPAENPPLHADADDAVDPSSPQAEDEKNTVPQSNAQNSTASAASIDTDSLVLPKNVDEAQPKGENSLSLNRTSASSPVEAKSDTSPATTATVTVPSSAAKTEPEEDEKVNIKVPFPVFVASLYKSGTTSVHGYFECGGQRSAHYWAGKGKKRIRSGVCMRNNWQKKRPLFEGCSSNYPTDIWTDNNANGACWDPSVFALKNFYRHYPNATILLTVRDPYEWVDSVERHGAWLLRKLQSCSLLWPTQNEEVGKHRPITRDQVRQFYEWQLNHVREFAKAHPSLTYVEIPLNSNETGKLLEDNIGIPSSCWGQKNKSEKTKQEAEDLKAWVDSS